MQTNGSYMQKLLIRLWWLEKRRDFKVRDIAIVIYILLVYAVVCLSAYFGASAAGRPIERVEAPAAIGLIFALAMAVADIVTKMMWKRDATFMDDYLKTKPISKQAWSRFVVFTTAASFWTVLMPLIFLPPLFLLQSVPQALACFAVMILLSFADSLFVTCFQRTKDRFLRFSLIAGWLIMPCVIALYIALTFYWTDVWVQDVGTAILALAVIRGLAAFIANEDNYCETRHKAAKQHSLGRVTLFTMQLYGTVRAKRLRNMIIITFGILAFTSYLPIILGDPNETVTLNAILAIVTPSLVLAQWTFGVEANFFQGLMTKPVTIRQLLDNCFRFYMMLNLAAALIMTPLAFLTDAFTPLTLVGALSCAVFINLYNLPTCLFSTRIDIFGNSFFNMQGANAKINLFAIALLIPFCVFAGTWALWGETAWAIESIAAGVISLVIHRRVIAAIASRFEAKKYARIESFMD